MCYYYVRYIRYAYLIGHSIRWDVVYTVFSSTVQMAPSLLEMIYLELKDKRAYAVQ